MTEVSLLIISFFLLDGYQTVGRQATARVNRLSQGTSENLKRDR